MRKITYEQGCLDVEEIITRFAFNVGMRDKKVCGMIDLTLWSVMEGEGGALANAVITRYDLCRPANGSHEYFDDEYDDDRNPVIHLDPNFVVPDSDRIMPGDKKHPGDIKLPTKKKKLD